MRREGDGVSWRAVLRRLFRIVAALSLLLCVATVVFWVRSYTSGSAFGYEIDTLIHDPGPGRGLPRVLRRSYFFAIDRHAIAYAVCRDERFSEPHGCRFFHNDYSIGGPINTPEVEFLGFAYCRVAYLSPGPDNVREWTVPYWALLLTLACPPSIAVRAILRRRHRRQPGHCPSCGYDLRATPDRCPECGAVPATR
jgi:hypothetical protein